MKICFFDFITLVGGATKGTVFLLERLRNKGVDVEVIDGYGSCLEYLADLDDVNIKYTILASNIKKQTIGYSNNKLRRYLEMMFQIPVYCYVFLKLFGAVFKSKPSHIMVNNWKSLFFVLPLKFIFGFKIILYFRIEGLKAHLPYLFVFYLNHFVDTVFSHSKNAIINMKKNGIHREIIYLPNCVKISSPSLNKRKGSDFKIFLNSGRVVPQKGYHTAIKAISLLKAKKYSVFLILPGIKTDLVYAERLQKLIEINELCDCVKFVGWVENVQQEVADSDCMILPSHSEGFPRSVIEAMLLKTPVCATPVGGIPEAIFDNETGFLFDIDDFVSLANKLESLILDKKLHQKIVLNAYNYASTNFDENSNTEVFLRNI